MMAARWFSDFSKGHIENTWGYIISMEPSEHSVYFYVKCVTSSYPYLR